jgi:hypothetical protein
MEINSNPDDENEETLIQKKWENKSKIYTDMQVWQTLAVGTCVQHLQQQNDGIDNGPIYSYIGVTSSALAVQMFGNAQDLQQQNVWYDDGPIHCNIPLTSWALVVHMLQITIAWTLHC